MQTRRVIVDVHREQARSYKECNPGCEMGPE